jgi:hypothetical protein
MNHADANQWKDAEWTYAPTDIANFNSPPVFTNASVGDFSLAAGSPGKGVATDTSVGPDIGIAYNTHLKRLWMDRVFARPAEERINVGTPQAFTVDPNHFYQMWFHVPLEPNCNTTDTITIEGVGLTRDIATLNDDVWTQPTEPGRWITLGRHQSGADGVLNVSWGNNACVDGISIQQLPNSTEAFQWILDADASTPVLITGGQITGGRIE